MFVEKALGARSDVIDVAPERLVRLMARDTLAGARIGKSFGGLRVLHEVDFSVAEGEIVALIGPNGAGKTTLFNVISGLVRPSAGSLRLGGRELVGLPAFRISRLGRRAHLPDAAPLPRPDRAGQCPGGGPVQRARGGGARGAARPRRARRPGGGARARAHRGGPQAPRAGDGARPGPALPPARRAARGADPHRGGGGHRALPAHPRRARHRTSSGWSTSCTR